ncbi:MAG: hypothetical protein M5U28_03195 [Sandaracinaceae bacterium]|nr:hypothetical protein [Sandaracinaceae bacterium]
MKLSIELDDNDARTLEEHAAIYSVSREELVRTVLAGVAEGLRRPGAWEAQHAEALLGLLATRRA